jgi:hypothetical protein
MKESVEKVKCKNAIDDCVGCSLALPHLSRKILSPCYEALPIQPDQAKQEDVLKLPENPYPLSNQGWEEAQLATLKAVREALIEDMTPEILVTGKDEKKEILYWKVSKEFIAELDRLVEGTK